MSRTGASYARAYFVSVGGVFMRATPHAALIDGAAHCEPAAQT